jgi:hypothetical protein
MGQIASIVIAMLIVGALVAGTSQFYSSVVTSYGQNSTDLGVIDQTQNLSSRLSSMANKTSSPVQEANFAGFIIFGTWEAAKLSVDSIGSFTKMVGTASTVTTTDGTPLVPYWLPSLAIGIVMCLVLFTLISAGLKGRV